MRTFSDHRNRLRPPAITERSSASEAAIGARDLAPAVWTAASVAGHAFGRIAVLAPAPAEPGTAIVSVGVHAAAPAGRLYRDTMPEAIAKKLDACSQTHRDRDLDVRASKYKQDEGCIYALVKKVLGSSLEREAGALVQWAAANQFLAGDLLRSMYSAAASSAPRDRFGAATVYAIVSAAGSLGLMNRVRDGKLKISTLDGGAFDAKFGERVLAMYMAHDDTLFLRAGSVDVEDTFFRSLVMHELTHFTDDAQKAGGTHLDAERRAFLDQARYLLGEIRRDATVVESVAGNMVSKPQTFLITAALLQAQDHSDLKAPCELLINQVDALEKAAGRKGVSFTKLIAVGHAKLQELMDKQMTAAGITDATAEFDGIAE